MLFPFVFFLLIENILGRKDGAPEAACSTMFPGHGETKAQALNSALARLTVAPGQINAGSQSAVPGQNNGQSFQVTLSSSTAFKGFFVQARASGMPTPQGVFNVMGSGGAAKLVACNGLLGSAVTHVDNSLKMSVSFGWTPPVGFSGTIIFVATVVQDFNTFWVGIQAEPILVGSGSSLAAGGSNQGSNLPSQSQSGAATFPAQGGSSFSSGGFQSNMAGSGGMAGPVTTPQNTTAGSTMAPFGAAGGDSLAAGGSRSSFNSGFDEDGSLDSPVASANRNTTTATTTTHKTTKAHGKGQSTSLKASIGVMMTTFVLHVIRLTLV